MVDAPPIRPEVLRRYHEAAYGHEVADDDAFKEASVDEYVLLKRIQFPKISRRQAAKTSPRRAVRKLAEGLPAELYQGIDILRIAKGRQAAFEIAADLAQDILGSAGMDNGELEHRLQALAKQAGQKAQWSSEGDGLVVRAKDIETCRWVIDCVHAMRG